MEKVKKGFKLFGHIVRTAINLTMGFAWLGLGIYAFTVSGDIFQNHNPLIGGFFGLIGGVIFCIGIIQTMGALMFAFTKEDDMLFF